MLRHPALHPLSHDHHDVLMHARRLRGEDPRVDATTARQRFLRYHDAVLVHHFAEEEAALLPHLPDRLAARLIHEHDDLRRRAAELAAVPQGQAELGAVLRDHVRFEEGEVFQHLQTGLDEAEWERLQQSAVGTRARLRPGAGDGEDCFLG